MTCLMVFMWLVVIGEGTPTFRQESDCGVVALYFFLKVLDVPATYDAVAAHVQVDKESGASLQQLCGAANEFGLEVESRFVSPDALLTASRHSFPMILHLQDGLLTPNGHFVVAVERIDGGKFRIFDPTTSRTAEKSAKQAFAHFSGYVLTVKQRFFSPATRIAVPCVLVLGLGFCCWVRRRCRS